MVSRSPASPIACSDPWRRTARGDLCGHAQVDYRRPSQRATISLVARGCSAVGSAQPCQGWGRGFESRHPLDGAEASTPAVEWPSGEATACKAVHTGSIPVSTSTMYPARLAQRESASLTRKRSLVQSQYRAPVLPQFKRGFAPLIAGRALNVHNSGFLRLGCRSVNARGLSHRGVCPARSCRLRQRRRCGFAHLIPGCRDRCARDARRSRVSSQRCSKSLGSTDWDV